MKDGPDYDYSQAQPRVKIRRLHKSGNALGFYIPAEFCQALAIKPGDDVRVYIVRGVLCLQPITMESFVPRVVGVAPVAPVEPVLVDD